MTTLHHLDDRVFLAINAFARHTVWLHGLVRDYAAYGVVLFAVLLLAALVWRRTAADRVLAAAGWACIAVLLAAGLNQPLVAAFGEPRPYTAHHGLLVLARRSTDFSFPSDHAVMAGAAAAGLWLVSRVLGAIGTVAAVVMGFSRVYIAAHYPWDVAVGLLFGATVALLGWLLLRGPLTALSGRLRQLPGLRQAFPSLAPSGGPHRSAA